LILGVIIITPLTAFAISYDNTGIRLSETPQFCYLTDDVTLGTISFIALHQWEKQLVLNDPLNWKMDIKQINSLNWNECNVIIQFVETSTNPLDLGKTDLNDKEALITIPLYHEGKKLSSGDISNSVTHELGHSMGLGHYNSGILNDSDSIMSPQFEPFKNIKLEITLQDVLKMSQTYPRGFE
jgi:hypothetical protein